MSPLDISPPFRLHMTLTAKVIGLASVVLFTYAVHTRLAMRSVDLYLSKVTVHDPTPVGRTKQFGVVYTSETARKNITISLRSNSPFVTVPAAVTIPAGKSSATFPVTVGQVGVPSEVCIVASSGGWTQRALLYAVPNRSSLSPPGISVQTGSRLVRVEWPAISSTALEEGGGGYRIVRTNPDGTTTTLPAGILTEGDYVDTDVRVGSQYTYATQLVDARNRVVASGPSDSVTVLSGGELTWALAPTISNGEVKFRVKSGGRVPLTAGEVFIDGARYIRVHSHPGSKLPNVLFVTLGQGVIGFGLHTLTVVSEVNGVLFRTPVASVRINDPVPDIKADDFVGPGDVPRFSATLRSTSGPWTVSVVSHNGETIRSWTGNGSEVSAAWDGTDPGGRLMPNGDYSFTLDYQQGWFHVKKKTNLLMIR